MEEKNPKASSQMDRLIMLALGLQCNHQSTWAEALQDSDERESSH